MSKKWQRRCRKSTALEESFEEHQEKYEEQQKSWRDYKQQAQMDALHVEANEGKGWKSKSKHHHKNAPGKGKGQTKELGVDSIETEWHDCQGTMLQWWKNCNRELFYQEPMEHGRRLWTQ